MSGAHNKRNPWREIPPDHPYEDVYINKSDIS